MVISNNRMTTALKGIAILYGVWGLFNFVPIPVILTMLAVNASSYSAQEWTHHLVELGILMVNAAAGISIGLTFWKYQRRGLYVALAYNALLLGVLLWGVVAGRISDSNQSMDYLLIYALLPSAVIAICLHHDTKQLFVN